MHCVFISASHKTLKRRLGSLLERGVVIRNARHLKDLYDERTPLYEKYADLIVDVDGLTIAQAIDKIHRK